MKKRVKLFALIAIFTVMTNICAYASNIHVELEGLTKENKTMIVDFEYISPVTADGISMVPIRTVCEDAGMSVMWQQNTNAVVVKLNADKNSNMPIEKYAYNVLRKKASDENRLIEPECIFMTMYLNSEEAMLHYNYIDNNVTVSYGKLLNLPKSATMIGDGAIAAPLRTVFNQLGLWIEWQDTTKVAKIKIPDFINYTNGLELFESYEPQCEAVPVKMEDSVQTSENGVYLGNFKITHYCPCEICCGQYAGQTAWGGALKPGYTIAVDPEVIGKLSKVKIDGYGMRVAEDCGGAIKGNKIDVAVATHEEALALGVTYKDVWLVG